MCTAEFQAAPEANGDSFARPAKIILHDVPVLLSGSLPAQFRQRPLKGAWAVVAVDRSDRLQWGIKSRSRPEG
jgi:hypothetical protein